MATDTVNPASRTVFIDSKVNHALSVEIDRLITIEALVSGLNALAVSEENFEIARLCDVIRERLAVVCNDLDLIALGRVEEFQP